MPAFVLPLALMAGSAIAGALGNKKQTQTSTPTIAPEYKPLQAQLLSQIMARLGSTNALPAGYEEGAIRNINNTYGLAGQGLQNRLTARGLGTSPIAGAGLATMEAGRAGQIATMQSGLPLLTRQMQDQNLALGQQMMSTGRGTEVTSPGNPWGGAFQSASDMLAYLYGKGAFGKTAAGGGANQGQLFLNALQNFPVLKR